MEWKGRRGRAESEAKRARETEKRRGEVGRRERQELPLQERDKEMKRKGTKAGS